MKSYIRAISIYLPGESISNDSIQREFPNWNIAETANTTGVYKRHINPDGQFASDMAFYAGQKLFAETDVKKEEIDFILLCTQSPDYLTPATSCILQERLGLPTSAGSFDFSLGCTGFVYGLMVAAGLIGSCDCRNVLLITTENIMRHIHRGDKSAYLLFGDGAAATVISKQAKGCRGRLGKFVYGTDGKGADLISVKCGATRFPLTEAKNIEYTDNYGNTRTDSSFYMDGPRVFSFSVRTALELTTQLLHKHGLSMSDIDLFVFHQANKIIIETIGKKLDIDQEKLYFCLENYGNTVPSTVPIALFHAHKEGKIKKGSKVLIAAFGVGLSWGGTIVTY